VASQATPAGTPGLTLDRERLLATARVAMAELNETWAEIAGLQHIIDDRIRKAHALEAKLKAIMRILPSGEAKEANGG
jgi:hypothetical protein